mgnify:FL=1
MIQQEKKEFIESLVNAVRDDISGKIDAMPENWDGIEVRQYIADRFQYCVVADSLRGSRKKEYKNELLVNGRL